MHTARIVIESARVSQVEMQFSQCFLPSLGSDVVTAGALFITAPKTGHHHRERKNIQTGRGLIANNICSGILAQGRSTSSHVLERSTKRPWPCPQC